MCVHMCACACTCVCGGAGLRNEENGASKAQGTHVTQGQARACAAARPPTHPPQCGGHRHLHGAALGLTDAVRGQLLLLLLLGLVSLAGPTRARPAAAAAALAVALTAEGAAAGREPLAAVLQRRAAGVLPHLDGGLQAVQRAAEHHALGGGGSRARHERRSEQESHTHKHTGGYIHDSESEGVARYSSIADAGGAAQAQGRCSQRAVAVYCLSYLTWPWQVNPPPAPTATHLSSTTRPLTCPPLPTTSNRSTAAKS